MIRAALPILLALAATSLGCGATPGPIAAQAPTARAAEPATALKKARPTFRFYAYEALSPEERRVLDASMVQVGTGAEARKLSGEALYAHYAAAAPKSLANYLNQTAVLASTRFANGRTALSYVERLEGLKINHVYAAVEPALKDQIAAVSAQKSRPDVAFVGPEDSSLMHGKFDTSYRENRPYTSQQFAFASADGFTRVDIDLDEECPLAGSKLALAQHLIRAIKHEILRKWPGEQYGENSEPDYFFRALTLEPVQPDGQPNKVGRGLRPAYELVNP